MTTETTRTEADERRWDRLEAESEIRPHTGPCLICGTYQPILFRGRRGGLRVYCGICAIGTRTPALKGRDQ